MVHLSKWFVPEKWQPQYNSGQCSGKQAQRRLLSFHSGKCWRKGFGIGPGRRCRWATAENSKISEKEPWAEKLPLWKLYKVVGSLVLRSWWFGRGSQCWEAVAFQEPAGCLALLPLELYIIHKSRLSKFKLTRTANCSATNEKSCWWNTNRQRDQRLMEWSRAWGGANHNRVSLNLITRWRGWMWLWSGE